MLKTPTLDDVRHLFQKPLLELVFDAATVHRQHHNPQDMQLCHLLSIKTGGCSEDCGYCPQAARYHTDVTKEKLMDVEAVLQDAQRAKSRGATRFCMGAAWREVKDNEEFDRVETRDDCVVMHLKSGKRVKADCILFANGRTGNTDTLTLKLLA